VVFLRRLDKPAFLKALLIHILLVLAVGISFYTSDSIEKPKLVPQHISAVVVDKRTLKPTAKKTKRIIKKKPKPKAKPKPKPKKKAKVKPKPKKKPKAKPKPKVKPKVKPKTKPKMKPKVDEPSFEDLLAQEAEKLEKAPPRPEKPKVDLDVEKKAKERAKFVASEVDTYTSIMRQTVARYWNRPPSARTGMQVILKIRLLPGGELNSVTISQSSGNAAFDHSAVKAVERAGRFTVPSDSEIFDKHFRAFSILFNPEDLKY